MNRYNYNGPDEFRPLSPWEYFGYSLLFSIPIIGVVMLILFSFSSSNINRRSFARSYWCVYIIAIILFLAGILTNLTVTGAGALFNSLRLP